MSVSGGNYDEMGTEHISDKEIEMILSGSVEPGSLLGDAIVELRDSVIEKPAGDLATLHIAAAVNEARLASQAVVPVRTVRRRPRHSVRRKAVFTAMTSSLIIRLLLGSLALAATGGTVAAATGNLPDPIQAVVSEAADNIGIDIPHPDEVLESADVSDNDQVSEPADVSDSAEIVESDETSEITEPAEAGEVTEAPEAAETTELTEAPEAAEATELTEPGDASAVDQTAEASEAAEPVEG